MSLSTTQKVILLLFYISICVLTEIFYREKLFSKSIEFEKEFQHYFSSKISQYFFTIITNFGSQVFYIPVFIIFFYLNPINYNFYILSTLIISIYIDCLLKIIYHDPRPFWKEKNLYKECEGGFGNPSGHSFGSCATYLGIYHLSMRNKYFKKKNNIKIFFFFFTLIFIFLIMISRLYNGTHSINQIIYGFLLGLSIYFLMFFIINGYLWNPKSFFEKIEKGKIFMIPLFIFLIAFILPFYFIFNADENDINDYNIILNSVCPNVKNYAKFNNNGMLGCLLILIVFGMYLGILFLKKKSEINFPDCENKIINWNNMNYKITFIRGFISIIFCLPVLLFLIVIFENNLLLFFIINIGCTFFFSGFLLFGPGLYYGFILGEKIEKKLYNINVFSIESKTNYAEVDDDESGEKSKAAPPDKFTIVEIL